MSGTMMEAPGSLGEIRPLGATGILVSAVGQGTWAMGAKWGPTDDQESMRTLHHALDHLEQGILAEIIRSPAVILLPQIAILLDGRSPTFFGNGSQNDRRERLGNSDAAMTGDTLYL